MMTSKSRSVRKAAEDVIHGKTTVLDVSKKELESIIEIPSLHSMSNITQLILCHNKIIEIPEDITLLGHLELLNCFNNTIIRISPRIADLSRLRILNLGMNRLNALPRGFGALPSLEILDLSYNNLNEKSLPDNFFNLETLRALYLGDNDFEEVPAGIGRLSNLEILVLRDNDLLSLPAEVGSLYRLRELLIQGNRLSVLPPELGNVDLVGTKQVVKLDENPWVTPIADQIQVGVSHVFDYIRSETYKYLYEKHVDNLGVPPPKADKSKKISRKR